MKKSISVILCLSLVLCSLFSISSVAFAAEASTAKSLLDVKTDGVFYDTITYTVYLKAGVNTAGAVVEAVYDPNVLEVVSAGQAQNSPISGYYTPGAKYDRNDMYNIGYIGFNDYKNGSKDTAFMQFTFKVKGTARPVTSVYFYCNQFSSDSQPQNEISGVGQEAFDTWTGTTLSTTHVTGATMFEGGVTVEWEPTIGATGYNVFKVVDGAWKIIGNTTDCYFVDTGVANNNVYQYTVRAYNDNGWQGNGWNSNFEQGVWVCYLLAPSFLWLSPSGDGVMASWTAAEGVDTYSLYRRTINVDGTMGSWVHVGTTNKTSYADTTGSVVNWNNYEYAVCSVSGNNESPKYTISQIYTNSNPYTTLVLDTNDGTWYCCTNGYVNRDYRGLLYYEGNWYHISNGVVDWGYTGLTYFCGDWYYVENGVLNWNYTGLSYFYGDWYYVENGKVNFNATTLAYFCGDWYYVENGKVNFNVTTLYYFYGEWYYVENGKVNFNATTLIYFYDAWYYVENGKVNFNAITLCYFYGDWYYVEYGKVNFNATTLVYFWGDWYYVEYGKVNFNMTTLFYFYNEWYYVENGKVNFNATTIVEFYDEWYYVEKGKVNFNAITLCYFNGDWYYVEYGKVNYNATTLCYFCDEWYYVEDGIVNFDATTLFYFYDVWYYIVDGKIAWSYTGLVEHEDIMYYVVNGSCDLTFNGTIEEDGNTYDVVDGIATLVEISE